MALPTKKPEDNTKSLAKISLMGGVAGRGLQVIQLLAVAKILGSNDFAIYAATYSTIMATAALSSTALSLGVNRFASSAIRSRSDLGTTLSIIMLIALPTAILGIIFSSRLLAALSGGSVNISRWFFIAAGIVVCVDATLALVAGTRSPKLLAGLEFWRGAGAAVGGTIGALSSGIDGALSAFALSELTTLILACLVARSKMRAGDSVGFRKTMTTISSVAGPGLISGSAVQISLWSGQIWALSNSTLAQYAVLALAIRLGNFVAMIPGMLTRNFLAHLTASWASDDNEWGSASRSFLKQNLALSAACLSALIPASFLVRWSLGDDYQALPLVMGLIGIGFFTLSFSSALGVTLIAMRGTALWFVSDIVYATILTAVLRIVPTPSPIIAYTFAFCLAGLACALIRYPGWRASAPRTLN